MIDIAGILRGLIQAKFKGIAFDIPNAKSTVGRRVQSFLFPGRDDKVFQDLGAFDGPIVISGVIIGDDYVVVTRQMMAACRASGPGTLIHPWLGELYVILTDQPTFNFDRHNLRMVTFEMTVELYPGQAPAKKDTLSKIVAEVESLQAKANALINRVLAPLRLTLAVLGTVQSIAGSLIGVFHSVVSSVGDVAVAIVGAVTGLAKIGQLAIDADYGANVSALFAGPPAAIAATSASLAPSAIAPGDLAPVSAQQDPRVTTQMLLTAVEQIVGLSTPSPGNALCLACAALTAASAVNAATDIVYTSQDDARAWQALLTAGIDRVADLAVALAPGLPAEAGGVWTACSSLKAAVVADINAEIGRLPAVQTFTLNSTIPTWLAAQALVGDEPSKVLAMYQDLVARNGIANPAMIGPGTFEALVA